MDLDIEFDSQQLFGKKELVGYQFYYREVGFYLCRLEHYERSLKYFDDAVLKVPTDKRALRGRAWAYTKSTEYKKALDDLRTALDLEPTDLNLLADRSLNIFFCGKFEDSLAENYRHLPKRRKPDHFYEGALQCRDIIQTCMFMTKSGHPLRDHFLVIRKLQWIKNDKSLRSSKRWLKRKITKKRRSPCEKPPASITKKTTINEVEATKEEEEEEDFQASKETQVDEEQLNIGSEHSLHGTIYTTESMKSLVIPAIEYSYRPLQHRTTNLQNYMASKYLDDLSKDKLFLDKLQASMEEQFPNKESSAKIHQLAEKSYLTLCKRQELMRSMRPFYHIKYQEIISSGSFRRRQEEVLRKEQIRTTEEANKILLNLKNAVKENRLKDVHDFAESLKKFCDSTNKTTLPNRQLFLSHIYRNVCQAFFELLKPPVNFRQREIRIRALLGLQVDSSQSVKDALVQYQHDLFCDWKKKIGTFTKRLERAKNPEEFCWLYYELSRFYLETKQFDLAHLHNRRCVWESEKIKNPKWAINAHVLSARAYLAQGKNDNAKTQINFALKAAKSLEDTNLDDLLQKAKKVIEDSKSIATLGISDVQKREQEILRLMQDEEKVNAELLFKRMAAAPEKRRMSILPGFQFRSVSFRPHAQHEQVEESNNDEELVNVEEDSKVSE